jgi:hypothetical protein
MYTVYELALEFLGYVFGVVIGFFLTVYVSILILESRRRRRDERKRNKTPV